MLLSQILVLVLAAGTAVADIETFDTEAAADIGAAADTGAAAGTVAAAGIAVAGIAAAAGTVESSDRPPADAGLVDDQPVAAEDNDTVGLSADTGTVFGTVFDNDTAAAVFEQWPLFDFEMTLLEVVEDQL